MSFNNMQLLSHNFTLAFSIINAWNWYNNNIYKHKWPRVRVP